MITITVNKGVISLVNKSWILEEADKLEFELGMKSVDPYAVIKSLDIDLIECDLGKTTLGQTIKNSRCYAILLNNRSNEIMKAFVAWHEISHVRLHPGLSTAEFRRENLTGLIQGIEAEANALAIEMMKRTINFGETEHMSNYQIIEYLGLPHTLDHLVI